jgi:small subunit ribosomal protein S20
VEELKLANTASAQKEIRKNARRRTRNRLVKSKTRTVVKRAVTAIDDGESGAAEAIRLAQVELDSAAAKGIIHPNAAARKKSRLMKRLKQATA